MKYIIFEDFAGHPAPILFPGRVSHGEMRELVPYSSVISAGYVETGGKRPAFSVHGHSVSRSGSNPARRTWRSSSRQLAPRGLTATLRTQSALSSTAHLPH